jgi:hypothetical protein
MQARCILYIFSMYILQLCFLPKHKYKYKHI